MNNIRRVPPEEGLLTGSMKGPGKKVLMRTESKYVIKMIDLVSKLFMAGELVMDTIAGIFATVTPCLQLLEHRWFV